jgi:fatty-acyl-CoA synthase
MSNNRRITLGELISRNGKEHADRPAIQDGRRNLSYGELLEETDRYALALLALGINPGDRVGLWLPNSVEWAAAWYGNGRLGTVTVPMDTWYKSSEAEYILKHSEAKVVIVADRFGSSDYREMLDKIMPNLPDLKHVIVVGEAWEGTVGWNDMLALGDLNRRAELEAMKGHPDDLAFILYTSGTTGKPKGVMLTHHNIVHNGFQVGERLRATPKDRFLLPVPFSHCFGCVMGITGAGNFGSGIVCHTGFDPDRAMEAVQKEKITIIYGVPTMFIRELQAVKKKGYDTKSLRTGIMAGAPCPVETVKAVKEVMHCNILIAYGLTEASPVVTMTGMEDPDNIRAETVGKVISGQEVRIVDMDRKPVPDGQTGELACRGYNIMKGYYKMPQETAETIDAEGWLYTGDLATRDAEGHIRIVGRKKEMLIVGGFNVYPREMEEYLIGHPDIIEASVVGVPDADLGEVVAVVVKTAPGKSITAQDVVDYCYGNIASAKVPRYVFVDFEIPFSGRGKVQKFKLVELLRKEIEEKGVGKMVPSGVRKG